MFEVKVKILARGEAQFFVTGEISTDRPETVAANPNTLNGKDSASATTLDEAVELAKAMLDESLLLYKEGSVK